MVEQRSILIRILYPVFMFFTYLFLYVPIIVIVVFSFNASRISVKWHGFSLQWYAKLFSSPEILDALYVSLIVAFCSTLLSVVIGTGFVVAGKWWKSWLSCVLFYPNVVLPDIALAIGILSIFSLFRIPLGYASLIVGHTIVGLGFVVPIVRARFLELDPFLTEASLDLGATNVQTMGRIIIPLLVPALVTSALIVFTLSLDDFLIAFFCSSPSVKTLSIYVYSQLKEMVDPSINAISTLLLVVSSLVVLVLCSSKMIDRVIDHE